MIAVTGAAGFIGSVLLDALIKRGEERVLVVDNLGSKGQFLNLRAKSFEKIVTPESFLESLSAGSVKPKAILHLGAITDTGERDADKMLFHNTRYTSCLANAAIEKGIRFVYASSASVYGDGKLGFSDSDELTPSLLPLNAYAFSKWLSDNETIQCGWSTKLASLRFFNVFGPNEYHKAAMASVVWHAYKQIKETGTVKLFMSHKPEIADGEQKRDFVYVKDVVEVVLWFLDHAGANGIFNLGTGEARSYNDLTKAIFGAMNRKMSVEYIPTPEAYRNSYQYFTQAQLTKLRSAGCDHRFGSLEETVSDYIVDYLETSNPYC